MGIITDTEHYQGRARRKPYKGRINGPCAACGDGDTAMEYHDHEPPSPSYTLAELRELSKEYLATSQLTDTLTPELILSSLLAWLARKEREANEHSKTESA